MDQRFGIKAVYTDSDIPKTPCLMNVVELLAQYAELDWLSTVKQRHGVVLPEYPQVEIAVLPAAPATSIEVRVVVWGIWAAIRDIMEKNKFFEVEFEILWDGEVVAYIYFTKPMDRPTPASSNGTLGTAGEPVTLLALSNTTGDDDILDTPTSTANPPNLTTRGVFEWTPFFTPTAKTLTPVEVFLTVLAGLKNAAPPAASDKVPGPYASAAVGVFANVQFYIHKRRSPRPRPPFFQYIHVITALRRVPAYMLQQARFAELVFVIKVDEVVVGEGYLEKGHYVPPLWALEDDGLGARLNVSLS